MSEPKFVQRDAFRVVGMQITTNPMTPKIPALWQEFVPRISEVADIAEPKVSYGVMRNFDAHKGTLEYMAGVSVTSLARLPESMASVDVPPNTYAVFNASLATMGDVFSHIYQKWLPRSEFEHAKAPYFERYDERFDPADPKSRFEIFIPVKARAE